MPNYIIYNEALETYVSDSLKIRTKPKIGFNPKDKNNIGYTEYNLDYQLHRFFGGFNIRIPRSFAAQVQVGGELKVFIDNTSNPANTMAISFTFTSANQGQNTMQAVIKMPAQTSLAPGILDIYGYYEDPGKNNITVFSSEYLEQVLP